MPAVKAHILNTAELFKDGSNVVADCGTLVRNATLTNLWTNFEGAEISLGGLVELDGASEDKDLCRACRKLNQVHHGKRYVARIVNGQELTHGEG